MPKRSPKPPPAAPPDEYRLTEDEFTAAADKEAAAPVTVGAGGGPPEEPADAVRRMRDESRKLLFEQQLQSPFHPGEVKWKPQAVKGNRCMAIAYIDARTVMDRLDAVCGVDGWKAEYDLHDVAGVVCKLSLRMYGDWVTKCDVGSPSEQPDAGDRLKAAFSDALKRAAVHFGVGRYLYRLPHQWVDYDPVKKRPTAAPQLPAFALPAKNMPEPRPYFDPGDELLDLPAAAAAATPPAAKPADKHHDDADAKRIAQEERDKVAAAEQAKKAEAAASKNFEEYQSRRLDWWIKSMDGCDGPAQLTQLIGENLKDENVKVKPLIWDKIQSYIKGAGWKWNTALKEVYNPAEEPGEAIPF